MPTMPNGFTPTVAAYSHDGPGGVLRTEVSGGASRYSADYDRGTQKFSVTMILDAAQFSVWTAFFVHIIKKGALAFDMPLDSGLGVAAHQVHIVPGSYSASRTAGIAMVVSFVAEAQSGVYALSDSAVAAYGLSAAAMPAGFKPTVAAYSLEGPGGTMRDGIAGGVAAYALDYDRGTQKFSVTLILTPPKFAVWSVWYHRLIKKGSLTFDMPLDSGFGTAPHACNIVPGSYSAVRTGGLATAVSFAVEAENKAYDFSALEAQAMVDLHNGVGNDVGILLARIARFANTDTLVLS